MTTAPQHLKHGYSDWQITLHWTVAALVVTNWLLGDAMSRVFNAVSRGDEVVSYGGAYAHIAIGLSVLLVMVARLAARIRRPVAVAPDSPHRILALLGRITHLTFYTLLFFIPTAGALAWFAGNQVAATLHEISVTALLAVLALHVSASLFHHYVLRDGLIRRIVRST